MTFGDLIFLTGQATLQENEGETLRQSELKAILKDQKLWLESGGKQGKRADLGGANLQGAYLRCANLHGANLQGAYLGGAYLGGANFEGARLEGASLQGASLVGANFEGARLEGADLRGASLQGAKFTTNFKKVGWFNHVTFSEDQIPWVVLHPKYPVCAGTLKWVKAEATAA